MNSTNYFGLFVLGIVYAGYVMKFRELVQYIDSIIGTKHDNNISNRDDDTRDANTWYELNGGKCRYKGEWKNGLPNGKGTLEYLNGTHSIIEATFVDGYAEGYGRQIFDREYEKTVPYYEGEFHRNMQHGKGEYYYGNGSYYKGEFQNGKFHGQGSEFCHIKNQTFIGEFYNDGQLKGEWK